MLAAHTAAPVTDSTAKLAAGHWRAKLWAMVMDLDQAHHDTLQLDSMLLLGEVTELNQAGNLRAGISQVVTDRMSRCIEENAFSETLFEMMNQRGDVQQINNQIQLGPIMREAASMALIPFGARPQRGGGGGGAAAGGGWNGGGQRRGGSHWKGSQKTPKAPKLKYRPNTADTVCMKGAMCTDRNRPESSFLFCRRSHPVDAAKKRADNVKKEKKN